MAHYVFDEVALIGAKSYRCNCGRRCRRRRKFYQTINPLNKNNWGRIKTHHEIYTELMRERDQWRLQFEECTHGK